MPKSAMSYETTAGIDLKDSKLASEIGILVLLKKPPTRVNYRCLGQNRGSLDKIRPVIIQISMFGGLIKL
jgi:hypothetical protein